MATRSAKKAVDEKATKPKSVVIPESLFVASELIRQVGDIQRKLKEIAADADRQIAELQQMFTGMAQPYESEIEQLVDSLYGFFKLNRDELTKNGKYKSVDLGTGTIGTRTNPHKVDFTKKKEEILENLHRLGLDEQFIRTVEEINREAMLESKDSRALAATVKGVKIRQTVEFFVKPTETLEEIAANEARLKRRVA